MRRVLASLITVCAFAACAPTYRSSEVGKVILSIDVCHLDCRRVLAQIGPSGVIAYGPNMTISHASSSEVASVFASMPIGDLQALAGPIVPTTMNKCFATVILSGGRSASSVVPCQSYDLADKHAIAVQSWLVSAAETARRLTFRARERAISQALHDGIGLSSVTLRMLGCYGHCPVYAARFDANGTATYDSIRVPWAPARHAKASISMESVRAALAAAGAVGLEPTYPVRAVDTFGASIEFVIGGKPYTSDGPDATTWGPEFRSTVARLDQLVVDSKWVPALPERKP